MDVKKCTVCNIEIDNIIIKKIEIYVKTNTTLIEKKYNNTTFSRFDESKKKGKVVDSVNNNKKKRKIVDSLNNNNRTLVIGFSNCGKPYIMNHNLHQKQEPIFIITKSINQYPNIKTQTSDEIQPLKNYEKKNSTIVFDDILLSKQESYIDLFFTRGRNSNIIVYYISQSYFQFPKNTILNNSNIIILFKQTLRDIILLFHDIAGLDNNLEEGKELFRKACETDYEYL